MASRRQNGEGSYIIKNGYVEYRKQIGFKANGAPNIVSRRGPTKSKAKARMDEYEKSNMSITKTIFTNMTVSEYFKYYIEKLKKDSVKPLTYESMLDDYNSRLVAFSGKHPEVRIENTLVPNLNNTMCCEYIVAMGAEYSTATITKFKNRIKASFEWLKKNHYIKENPWEDCTIPVNTHQNNIETIEDKILSIDDIKKIVEESKRTFSNGTAYYRCGPFIVFLLFTGLRIGEALALKWKNVDLKRNIITVRSTLTRPKNENGKRENYIGTPKTKSSIRTIRLSKQAIRELEIIRNQNSPYNSDEDYVFITQNNQHIIANNLTRTLKNMEKNAQTRAQNSSIHMLRHSFASMCIEKGMDIATLSKILGHSKTSTTYDIYVHILEKRETQAISMLDDL